MHKPLPASIGARLPKRRSTAALQGLRRLHSCGARAAKFHDASRVLTLSPRHFVMSTVRWIKSTSWELPFFGLPQEIPWPADVDPAIANQSPFEVEHLLNAIEQL